MIKKILGWTAGTLVVLSALFWSLIIMGLVFGAFMFLF